MDEFLKRLAQAGDLDPQKVEALLARRDWYHEQQTKLRTLSPTPGFLFDFPGTGSLISIHWLLLKHHPDDPNFVFLVPVDDIHSPPLKGVADLDIPGPFPGDRFMARANWSIWAHIGLVEAEGQPFAKVDDECLDMVDLHLALMARGLYEPGEDDLDEESDPLYAKLVGRIEREQRILEKQSLRYEKGKATPVPLGLRGKSHHKWSLAAPPQTAAPSHDLDLTLAASSPLDAGTREVLKRVEEAIVSPGYFLPIPSHPAFTLRALPGENGLRLAIQGPKDADPPALEVWEKGQRQKVTWSRLTPQICRSKDALAWQGNKILLVLPGGEIVEVMRD